MTPSTNAARSFLTTIFGVAAETKPVREALLALRACHEAHITAGLAEGGGMAMGELRQATQAALDVAMRQAGRALVSVGYCGALGAGVLEAMTSAGAMDRERMLAGHAPTA